MRQGLFVFLGVLAITIGASAPTLIVEAIRPGSIAPLNPPTPGGRDAKQEHQRNAADEHQHAQAGEQPAESAPLAQQPQGQHPVAAKAEREGGWYAEPDWWVAGFTAALFIATSGLWWFTARMWWTTRQAVRDGEKAIRAARRTAVASVHQARASRRHADIAERTLVGLERPYLFIGDLRPRFEDAAYLPTTSTRPVSFRVEFNLDNKGRTPAIIRAINRKIVFERALAFDDPPYDYAFTLRGGESVIGAGLRGPVPPDPLHNLTFRDFTELGITTTDDQEFKDRAFFFFGFAIYGDVLENRYKKGFGFIYSPERKTFLPFGGTAYNYDRRYDGEDDDKFPQIIA